MNDSNLPMTMEGRQFKTNYNQSKGDNSQIKTDPLRLSQNALM